MTSSFITICIFIIILTLHICFGEIRRPITISEFLKKCNKTIYIFSERDTNIKYNDCLRAKTAKTAKTIKNIKQNHDNTFDNAKQVSIQEETKNPNKNLRNGEYSNQLMKNNLRGTPPHQSFATYNPPNRYCYSILYIIKHIVGV